jgi:methanogenic corrinoid protein MtbC1
MSDTDINGKIISINSMEAQQENVINLLIQSMVDMAVDDFENHLDEYIAKKGIEKTINQIIFPFMEKIGVLWITGHINPAQEHLVSNIVRQKLIVGTESISSMLSSGKSCVLFLPEGEFHELGLLFIQYMLKSRGTKVLYLGSNVPLEDVEYVIKHKSPDFVYTHLTSVSSIFSFDRFIQQSLNRFGNVPMIISGRLAASYENKIPPQIHFKKSLQEVKEFITTL